MKKISIFLLSIMFMSCVSTQNSQGDFDYQGTYIDFANDSVIEISENEYYNTDTNTTIFIEKVAEYKGAIYFNLNGFDDATYLIIRETKSGDITGILFGPDFNHDVGIIDKK